METIYTISFLNIGRFEKSVGQDFFDQVKPGVAVLFGEDHNYICYYHTQIDNSDIEKIEKIDDFEEWIPLVSKFFKNSYGIEDELLLESLIKSADEEDEDGCFEYIENNGGEVVFDNPNSIIQENLDIYIVKQQVSCIETGGKYSTNEKQFNIDGNMISLKELSSGFFDDNHEVVVYWKK